MSDITAAIRQRILEAVTAKRMNVTEIAATLGEPVRAVQVHVKQMMRARPPQLRVVGTWAQLAAYSGRRIGNTRRDADVFGPPGAPYLPELDDDLPGRRRRAKGSGVITPGHYVSSDRQTLRRDPFEHMKLALLTRG